MPFFKKSTPLTPAEALPRLEGFCAYRERAPREVTDKIRELGLRGAEAEQLFDVLADDGFFSEERFARAFAGGKFRQNYWGRVRIRLELQQRGISPKMIAEALAEATPDEAYHAVFQKLMEKKRAELERLGAENAREKLAAYLIRTGFEPDLVFPNLR